MTRFCVRGAKPRADLVSSHVVPQSDAKKWRNSAPLVPSASACCTGVPGVLPLLQVIGVPAARAGSKQQNQTQDVCCRDIGRLIIQQRMVMAYSEPSDPTSTSAQ